MNVHLISYTPDALNLLLRTKNTRLSYDNDPSRWPEEKRTEHLAYMRDTIHSSWEFVDYVFRIEGVTRAFTHQLVRTRTGSYAQEAQRVIDARAHPVVVPPKIEASPELRAIWDKAVQGMIDGYAALLDAGVPPQDARGLLPTNITTSIMAKFNLRTLSDMAKLRLCTRTQGEYQEVFRAMRALVIEVHPWAESFIQVECVSSGRCAFPRYGRAECPVYKAVEMSQNVGDMARGEIEVAWSKLRYEAAPVARAGKAM